MQRGKSNSSSDLTDRASNSVGALVVLCLTFFLVAMDNTIINVALPTFSRTLGSSTSSLQWITDAYTTAFAGLIIVGGHLADRRGRRPTLQAALIIFTIGSVLAANATSTGTIIAGRAVMGVGAALAVPASLSMLVDVFRTPKAKATAIAGWTASAGVGVAIGPLVGGALLSHFWWGSIFWFNAGVALTSLLVSLPLLPKSKPSRDRHFDILGVVLSVLALTSLVGAIIEAPTWGWTSIRFIIVASIAVLAFIATWMHAQREPNGVIHWSLLMNSDFSIPSIAMGATYFAIFGYLFLVTQYLQEFLGQSSFSAGLHFLPAAISVVVGSGITRVLQTKLSSKVITVAGLLIMVVAVFEATQLQVSSGYGNALITLVLGGLSMGLVLTIGTDTVMETLDPDETGTGAAINVATMEIGGALGVAVFGTIFNDRYRAGITNHLSNALPHRILAVVSSSFGGGVTVGHAAQKGTLAVVLSSFVNGFHKAAVSGIIVTVLTAILVAVTLKGKREQNFKKEQTTIDLTKSLPSLATEEATAAYEVANDSDPEER